jgi:hypothetical protein
MRGSIDVLDGTLQLLQVLVASYFFEFLLCYNRFVSHCVPLSFFRAILNGCCRACCRANQRACQVCCKGKLLLPRKGEGATLPQRRCCLSLPLLPVIAAAAGEAHVLRPHCASLVSSLLDIAGECM